MVKYSIVIPTYNKFEETLQPCLDSLIENTNLEEAEIIVVANGCTDRTESYVGFLERVNPNIRLLSFKEPLGYTKAGNEGLKAARGEYIVMLNNDTRILADQGGKDWLKILEEPFLTHTHVVGITGPMKEHCPYADRDFLLFFCVMISRQCLNDVGLMDEIFSPGYGEDTDYCCRAQDAGYDIVQVPDESRPFYGENKRTGNYPIYHEGNVTFKNWPGGEELLRKNRQILKDRYNKTMEEGVDISRAQKCDGYMSDTELEWLASTAKSLPENSVLCEVGSWHGRSGRAIADNLSKGSILYCVDTWKGSVVERETNHVSAKMMMGDHAFYEFLQNNIDLIQQGKIIPLRLESVNAAAFFKEKGIELDFCFVDAGHTYEEVLEDIRVWSPLVKDKGILCGHDYYHPEQGDVWEGVRRAVDECFGHKGTDMGYIYGNSIWRHVLSKVSPPDADLFLNKLMGFEDTIIPFPNKQGSVDADKLPDSAVTMLGYYRLLNLKRLTKLMVENKVQGSFVDAGVWRGGSSILMTRTLRELGDNRDVFVCDSFQGLPPAIFKEDAGSNYHNVEVLKVPEEQVRSNFNRLIGWLDANVHFIKGWFRETLFKLPTDKIALLRADGDMYESTMDILINLYDKVAEGGCIIIDDYALEPCRIAVDQFRKLKNIHFPLVRIDSTGVYWIKGYGPLTVDEPEYDLYLQDKKEHESKVDIYDCFPFYNELEILDKRFETLYHVVDRFVIVEATKTHAGNPKPLYFKDNLARYAKYLDKVTHVIVEDSPELPGTSGNEKFWAIERHQRDAIMRGLTSAKDEDVIIISDADEIPDPEVVRNYKPHMGIHSLEMDLFYFNENTRAKDKWFEGKILPYQELRVLQPCGARYTTHAPKIPNAGKHLSYYGDVSKIIQKLESTAHQEYNTPYYKDPERIKKVIESGADLFERPEIQFEKV